MNILVFEYITGGGFVNTELPEALANEGGIMLRALTHDLLSLEGVSITVPIDHRLDAEKFFSSSDNTHLISIEKGQNIIQLLPEIMDQCDAIWPVAPESDSILTEICRMVEAAGKTLLSSSSLATEITGNKLSAFFRLRGHGIPTVPTELLSEYSHYQGGEWVVKPIDGVGCENTFLIHNRQDFEWVRKTFENPSRLLVQPYIKGEVFSLSCLFKQGKGWLLSCNKQQIKLIDRRFTLKECEVNIETRHLLIYSSLINQVARAIPGLWGYAGIDFIESKQEGPVIIEINPRLTTSYAGIKPALGINSAEQVLQLIDGEPAFNRLRNRQIKITLSGERSETR